MYKYIYINNYTYLPTSQKLTNYNCKCETGNLRIVVWKLLQDFGKPVVGGHITNESQLFQLFRKTDKPRNTKDGNASPRKHSRGEDTHLIDVCSSRELTRSFVWVWWFVRRDPRGCSCWSAAGNRPSVASNKASQEECVARAVDWKVSAFSPRRS